MFVVAARRLTGSGPQGARRSAARRRAVGVSGLAASGVCAAGFWVALAACGFPAPEACRLECGANGACPSGFECQAASQLCVPEGTSTPCLSERLEPNQPGGPSAPDATPDLDAGSGHGGSSPQMSPPEDAAAGTSGAGGAGGEPGADAAGAAGAPTDPAELAVESLASGAESACTGSELRRTFRVSGGVGPYLWRVVQAPSGVQASESAGAESSGSAASTAFEVFGVPGEPGPLLVEVEDAAGQRATSAAVLVYESPRIVSERLPVLCVGAGYAAPLLAEGGQPDEYVWSARVPPESGSPERLAELGLGIHGSTLSGEVRAPKDELAPFQVVLGVSDTHCASGGVELEAWVEPLSSDQCPTIELEQRTLDDTLPSACRGNAYSEPLGVEGGTPPYVWSELEASGGLHLDPESATIYGIAEADGVLAVAVTDADARTVRKSFAVQTRDKCWLAYVASEPGPARLQLVDGRLLARQPEEARRALPAASGSDAVVDFQFSPDGRFIAYRLGQDASLLRIELIRLSDLQTQSIDAGGPVAAYAWSEDAATLALVFSRAGQTFLGGVDVSAVERSVFAPGVPLRGVRQLDSQAVSSPDSPLLWFDGSGVAFLSPDPIAPARRRLLTTALGAAGFASASLHAEVDFSAGAQLLAGEGGVFVAEPETGAHQFFPSDGRLAVPHAPGAVVSPSGAWVGLGRGGVLEVFRAFDPSASAPLPFLLAPGCTTLLGWASGLERIACAEERGALNLLSFFELPQPPSLAELGVVPGVELSGAGGQSGRRRAFSPSGRWFAIAADDDLYVVRLDRGAPQLSLALRTSLFGIRPGALAFSPDETFLLIGAGNSLRLLNLERGLDSLRELSNSALIDDACSERFADGSRQQWCGSPAAAPELSWSSRSDLVAYRSALGTLNLLDLSSALDGDIGAPLSPDRVCTEACSSSQSARFQP